MDEFVYNRLKKNMVEMITEQQCKLGFLKETVRLYYLEKPLMRLTGCDSDVYQKCLEFCDLAAEDMGHIKCLEEEGRYCFIFSPEVSEYVHEHMHEQAFLRTLVETVGTHGTTIEQVIAVFKQFSEHVYIEKKENEDFDYLVFFEDGIPDEMRYCLTDEGCHVIYHRYMKEDYEEIFGE